MTNNRQQLLVIGTIAIVAIFLGDKVIVSPLTDLWDKRVKRIKTLTQEIADGESLVELQSRILQGWRRAQTNSLPAERARAEDILHDAVDRWEKESKIKVTARKFQERPFPEQEYSTIECSLDAAGTIETVTRFLYNVEQEPLPIRIEDLKIQAKDNDGRELLVGMRISGLIIQSKE